MCRILAHDGSRGQGNLVLTATCFTGAAIRFAALRLNEAVELACELHVVASPLCGNPCERLSGDCDIDSIVLGYCLNAIEL